MIVLWYISNILYTYIQQIYIFCHYLKRIVRQTLKKKTIFGLKKRF